MCLRDTDLARVVVYSEHMAFEKGILEMECGKREKYRKECRNKREVQQKHESE